MFLQKLLITSLIHFFALSSAYEKKCKCSHPRPYDPCQESDVECLGPNEEFTLRKRSCPPEECSIIVAGFDCCDAEPPKPGCACKPGFLRVTNSTSPCVPIEECPQFQLCRNEEEPKYKKHCYGPKYRCPGPNEEFTFKKRTCPPEECFIISANFDCTNAKPPRPGCACKPGFLRATANSPCIPIDQCPQLRPTEEEMVPSEKLCPWPNEEFTKEKLLCPPQECWAMLARLDCSTTPMPPQPGCICKADHYRLNSTSRCIHKCECPQLKGTLECEDYQYSE